MKLLILGYYSSINNAYLNFKSSLEKFHIENYKLVQINSLNFSTEISKTIQSTNCEIVLVLNIDESIISNTEDNIITKFKNFKTPVVFGAQSLKEDIELKRWWYNKEQDHMQKNITLELKFRDNLDIPKNKYANTSNFIGYSNYILNFIHLPSINYFIELNPDNCSLDLDSKIFGNITIYPNDLLFFRLNNEKIQDERSMEFPCIILYPNSRTDLHIRMNRYSKYILKDRAHLNYEGNWMIFLPLIYLNKFSVKYFSILFVVAIYFIKYFLALYL